MNIESFLKEAAANSGFTEFGLIQTKDLRFYPEIRQFCQGNSCRNYDKSWACPPAIGSLEECREKVLKYDNMLLFSQKFQLEDSFDFEGMAEGMHSFKSTVDRFAEIIRPVVSDVLILSNEGCGRCKVCTYPEAPCRFPDRLYPSLEGFCFIVSELAGQAGIRYNNGPDTVTFFGAVVF